MGNLNSLLGEVGYISFNELVSSIHRHIGLDKDKEQAEQILLHILDKYIDENMSGIDSIDLYNKIDDIWQPIAIDPYSEGSNYVVHSPASFGGRQIEIGKFGSDKTVSFAV